MMVHRLFSRSLDSKGCNSHGRHVVSQNEEACCTLCFLTLLRGLLAWLVRLRRSNDQEIAL